MASFMSDGFYDFIEIGTADFDTLIEKSDDKKRGLSIDVSQYHLDNLPNRKNVEKLCIAISDEEGEADFHYIPEEKIKRYNLPDFVRGCSSMYTRHPFVLTLLANESDQHSLSEAIDPEEVYESTTVEVTRLKSIVDQYNISHIKILKIDTEGSDGRILLDYFNYCKNEGYPFPFLIKYEHILLPMNERSKLLNTAMDLGYFVQTESTTDTVLIKKKTNE
jgi:FkbM family methyltransferase